MISGDNWAVNAPKDKVDVEVKAENHQMEILRQALQGKTEADRANSLRLLINARILNDPNGELLKLAEKPESLPQWETVSQPSKTPSIPIPTNANVNENR